MSKTINIQEGGHYDDHSYTDETHYHYGQQPAEMHEEPKEEEHTKAALRVRLRLAERLLELAGCNTANTDRIKLCRMMAFVTGTTEGYVKKIYTERHVDTSPRACKEDKQTMMSLLEDLGLSL